MYKQIFIIVILLILSISLYILIEKDNHKTVKIPEIIIHKKSIEFKITKSQNDKIKFKGIFVDKNSSQEIIKSLKRYNVIDNIDIDKNREANRDIIPFIKKLIERLDGTFLEWSITYKDRKLLISGKTTDIESKNSIDTLISFSSIDSFSDIELIKVEKDNPSEIISKLKSVVEDNEIENINSTTPTDDEIEDIILALKKLKPEKFIKNKKIRREIRKSKKDMKKRVKKRVKKRDIKSNKSIKQKRDFKIIKQHITRKKKKIIEDKKIVKNKRIVENGIEIEPAYQIPISYEEYKSLPDIQPIDNIEEFNRKLIENKKPIIDEGTIYIDKW